MIRRSILIHNDDIQVLERLNNDEAGRLFKAIYGYMKGEHDSKYDITTRILLMHFENRAKEMDVNVYVVKLSDDVEEFIKIGVSRETKKRFRGYVQAGYRIETIAVKTFGSKEQARYIENTLHKSHYRSKYIPLKEFPGRTECFNLSILNDIHKWANQ